MIWYDNDMIWCDYIYIYIYVCLSFETELKKLSLVPGHDIMMGLSDPEKTTESD